METDEHVYSPIEPEDNVHAELVMYQYDMTKVYSNVKSIYGY
jgi:hypothetical protein